MITRTQQIRFGSATATIDTDTGAVTSLRHGDREFFVSERAGGLLEYAVPLPDFPAHAASVDQHSTPMISVENEELIMDHLSLRTRHSALAIQTTIRLRSDGSNLRLRATVKNHSEHTIPQLAFPRLLGLAGLDDPHQTRVQLARTRVRPFVDLATRVDDVWWVDHKSQQYLPYGYGGFVMKWLDYGDEQSGLTLYGTDTRYTTQGLVLDNPPLGATSGASGDDHVDEAVDIRWVHYPFIEPGETWDSGDYVITTHDGDWYAGARSFAEFARPAYPYRAPQRIRDALAIRSVWPAVRSSPPTFKFTDLVGYAEEVADPAYGVAELVLWHWWLKNGLPMIIDERLGTRQELEQALAQCADVGVKVCMFVSHQIVRDTDESPPEWRHLNAAGQAVQNNWTYGYGMLPRFRAHHIATHAMLESAPLSKSWRETALGEYKKILSMGGTSIMYDVFRAPIDPEFNPAAADGRPDESGVRLIELAEAARTLIHEHDPEGAFAAEHAADVKVPYLDYTWEWINAHTMEASAPFRYVFPACRLNANVAHPRAAVIAFADGALLNLMPGGMRTARLADHPELATTVRHLAELRRRHLRYFSEGQFRFREGLQIGGGDARVYTMGDDGLLLVMINPTDSAVTARVRVDPLAWGGSRKPRNGELTALDGRTESIGSVTADDELTADLEPDGLAVIELRAADGQEES